MIDLSKIATEKNNLKTKNFSSMTIREAIEVMNYEDLQAVESIVAEFDHLEKLIELTSNVLAEGGRIIYIGAGTSGRLGVLDAVECPPTFGVDYNTVLGLIAGGDSAFVKAKEGVEDSLTAAEEDLKNIKLSAKDIVIGIAASGRTPYVIGGINYAKSIGAKNACIVCTKDSELSKVCDLMIEPVPGPEVIAGSTRLKAGTVTKLILNMISTISMNAIGKIYKNYMVDLKLSNKKLESRGINILVEVTGCTVEEAREILLMAQGQVKVAIVMILLACTYEEAIQALEKHNGKIQEIGGIHG